MPASRSALGRLGAFVVRRRRAVVLAWIVALVAAFGAMGLAGDWAADYNTPGSESKRAADALQERFPSTSPDTVDVVWRTAQGTPAAFLSEAADCRGLHPPGGRRSRPTGSWQSPACR